MCVLDGSFRGTNAQPFMGTVAFLGLVPADIPGRSHLWGLWRFWAWFRLIPRGLWTR